MKLQSSSSCPVLSPSILSRRPARWFRAIALASALFPSLALAVNYDWNNVAGETDWNNLANWTVSGGNGSTRNFQGTAVASPHVRISEELTAIRFRSSPAAGVGYTISGDAGVALTLLSTATGTGTAIESQITSGGNTISVDLVLGMAAGQSATFNVNTGSSLTLSGVISSTYAIEGLILSNKGEMFFSRANTYSGTTTLAGGAGVLHLNHAAAFSTGLINVKTRSVFANSSGAAITLEHSNDILLEHDLTLTSDAGTGDLSLGTGALRIGAANRIVSVTNAGSTLSVATLDAEPGNYNLIVGNATSEGKLAIRGAAGSGMQGKVTLVGGVLEVWHKDALGKGALEWQSNVTPGAATFQAGADLTGANAIANDMTLGTSNRTLNATIGGSHSVEFKGNFTLAGASRTLTVNNTGTTTFSGDQFLLGAETTGYTLTLNGSGDVVITSAIANNPTNVGNGRLIYTGTGTLTLAGANTYRSSGSNDATVVSSGRLIVNGSLADGGLTIAAGATLGGKGSIAGTTRLAGTLSPGNSAGTLTFQHLTLNSGATYAFEGGDQTVVSGTLSFDSHWTLALSGNHFTDGGSTVLFTYANLVGAPGTSVFIDTTGLGLTPSGPLSVSLVGNSVVLHGLTGYAPIPEPSTFALLFGAAAGAFLMMRRRRR